MPETAATICSRRSEIGKLGEPLHLTLIRRRVIGRDAHFERERLVARRAHFDAVRPGLEVQTLEDASKSSTWPAVTVDVTSASRSFTFSARAVTS
jgi:hypothetical protein